jgi:hypothetical protein
MCEGLPTQQDIPHSCDDERELKGTTPASNTIISIAARVIRGMDVRANLVERETKNKGKLRQGAWHAI